MDFFLGMDQTLIEKQREKCHDYGILKALHAFQDADKLIIIKLL